ncbi:DUF6789 family protein [Thioclava indica]|uniref:Uncharacterized protein n=1 Tax=Thioclava indica TaxID=1353528 RepID=A0A074KEU7_9RHOB|nr:DUF6789 family protein [Thioclava indica]KEO60072.1 hypothetical protein DT23_14370 [Thioclava indica]
MQKLPAGLVAGFIGTVVLSAMMLVKAMMGLMPQLDVVAMLSAMMGAPIAFGWLAHFMIGTLAWGGAFALFYDRIPGGSAPIKGVVFGVAAWLAMMLFVLPMAGAGLFGLALGMMAPVMTLMLHIIFGLVLGATFQILATPRLQHS